MSSTVKVVDGGVTPIRQAGRRGAHETVLGFGSRASRTGAKRSVEELRAELDTGRFATTRPVLPELADLFPGRGLRRGASYVVPGAALLTLALVAGSTKAGAWCGVVGMPDLGVEAGVEAGVDPGRLALIPDPGSAWPAVVGALADAFDVVVVRPARDGVGRISPGDAQRLAARFRERGTTVLVDGEWPKPELSIRVTESSWHGLGEGYGRLAGRRVMVTADRPTGGRARSVRLWLPGPDGRIRADEGVVPGSSATGSSAAGSSTAWESADGCSAGDEVLPLLRDAG